MEQGEANETHITSPLRELLKVAGPTVATMTSYTVMQFTDKWLVSRLGPELVGAQGNGGLAAWVPQSVAMGMFTVINTYVSQNMGAGKPERGPAYVWNGLYLAGLWYVLLMLPYAVGLGWVFERAGVDAGQAALATGYGRILVYGSLLNLCTRAVSQYFYGMHKAGVVLAAGVAANVFNLLASGVLVFGDAPAPSGLGWAGTVFHAIGTALHVKPMGLNGSGYGTVMATGLELLIPLCVFLGPRLNGLYGTRAAWRFSVKHLKDIIKTGWPAGLMFGNEMVCWGYFMVHLVSKFGKVHSSAGWIAHQYMSLSFMPAVGISVAATAMVGKYMGMGRPDIAEQRAWLSVRLAMAYMGVCAVGFVVWRGALVRLFVEQGTPPGEIAELVRLGSAMLIAASAFQLFDAMAMVLSGALRGAGDTVVPGVATVLASWGVIVGGGTLMTWWWPRLESIGPWMAAAAYIITLCIVLLARFLTGKWKSIKLLKGSAGEEVAGGVVDGVV